MQCDKCGSTNIQKNYHNCDRCHELKKQYERAHYRKHAIRKKQQANAYYHTNRDIISTKRKEKYAANPEPDKQRNAQYYKNNRKRCLEMKRQYYKENSHKWHESALKNDNWWLIYHIKLNARCLQCGFTDHRALTFHHRAPDNKLFQLTARYVQGKTMIEVLRELKKCDILCANCHLILHEGRWRSTGKKKKPRASEA
jgi:hypothetical protein